MVLSIQSIFLFILIVFGLAPEPGYIFCRGLIRSYGILGFVPSLNWGHDNLFIPRLSSFFSEASNFGRFLEYAIVVSFGYFKIFGRKRYLLASLICLSAFSLTFSMTCFFALFFGLSFYALLRTKRFVIKFAIPVLCVLFLISMHLILKGTYVNNSADRTPLQHMLFSKYGDAMRSTDNDIRGLYGGRVYSAIKSVEIFIANPFGLGLLQNKDLPIQSMNGDKLYTDVHVFGAFLFWLVKTGFVGIFILMFIFFIILRRMKTFWHDKKDIRNFISMAFMSISVHQLIVGDWFDAMFLFCMAIILVFDPKGKASCPCSHEGYLKLL